VISTIPQKVNNTHQRWGLVQRDPIRILDREIL
jgi:hypothetical protein